ncbi:MAG TPA: hypothetical protein VJZ71_15945 [Phycisphaerae bacterium]|nr:hypothetical protein [Phycisphaerae bacterium]
MTNCSRRKRWNFSPALRTLAALAGAGLGGNLRAADPLLYVPADVAGVIVFRDLDAAARKINPFLKQINPDHAGLDVPEVGLGLNLPCGQWDTSAPVVVVFARPEFSRESMIVAFRPAKGSTLLEPVRPGSKRVRKCEGPEGETFMALRGGTAFVGRSLKCVRMIPQGPQEKSILSVLTDDEKAMLARSDAFVRVDLNRWRDKLTPFVVLGLGLMKLSVAAQTQDGQDAAAVVEWLAGGARSFIDQMESASFSFSFDRETIRLDHHHQFAPGRSVAQYLSQVQRGEDDVLAMIPNRPFLMFAASNWRSAKGRCLTASLSKRILEMESVAKKIPAETRRRLITQMDECYGQVRGSAFMVAAQPGRPLPLELMGGYAVEDSASALKQLCFLHENSNEAMSAILPGAHCSGKFKPRHDRGVDLMELNFEPGQTPREIRVELCKVYGPKVRYQQAAAGPHRVLYTFAEPPTNVIDRVKNLAEDRVDKDPAVQRILSRLPAKPHLAIVFDLENTLAAVPYLASEHCEAKSGETPTPAAASIAPSQGLIGWAAIVRPSSICGQLAMDAQDAVKTFKLAREMPQALTKMSGTKIKEKTIIHTDP